MTDGERITKVETRMDYVEEAIKEHDSILEEYKDITYILKDMTEGMNAQKENIDKLTEAVKTTASTVDYIKSKQFEMETKQTYQPYIWVKNLFTSGIFKKVVVGIVTAAAFVAGYILK